MQQFSHTDNKGKVKMVNIATKPKSERTARAYGFIKMQKPTLNLIKIGTLKKGDVLSTAKIAAIMAAKQTANLIPLCHPLLLEHIDIDLNINEQKKGIDIIATCKLSGKTGVEMEALTAVSLAALTIYDMCKSLDKTLVIKEIKLLEKSGGVSGDYFYQSAD